jgi:gamma-glutamyltranspeptidase/glutathione hydrolase
MATGSGNGKPTRGVVVCPQPRAADVGAEVLAEGGNAFDAAIATAFAQMVTDPFMCGLGGMGSLQFYRAASGEHGMIDFHNRAGSRVTPGMWEADIRGHTEVSKYVLFDDFRNEIGYTSIMTPGTVAGFWEAHRRLATWPWESLLAPATRMAREGLPITPFVEEFWTRPQMPGMAPMLERLSATQACREIYVHPEGRCYRTGEPHRNPDMADTLERVAQGGADEFYRGELGRRIADDLEANGAFVTGEDLARYEVRNGAPLLGSYRGCTVASNPPPGGGPTLIEMLHILEQFDLEALDHGSAAYLDLVARAMAEEHAAVWAEKIEGGHFLRGTGEAPPTCTTHLSVYDEAGNAVSCTHTIGYGSGVVTPGLGFVHNNSMSLFDPVAGRPNSIAPGKGRNSAMCPTILLMDGKPFVIVGAPGSSVILSSVLQTILNIVDFGMSAVEAVTVPRIHCEGGALHAEARVEGAVCRELEAMGHEVKQGLFSFDRGMSRAHAVVIRDGQWQGGADPRGGGGVAYSR